MFRCNHNKITRFEIDSNYKKKVKKQSKIQETQIESTTSFFNLTN